MTITTAVRTGATNNGASASTTVACTLTGLTAGNFVVVGVGWVDTAGSTNVSSVTDSAGNTYTALTSKQRNSTQQYSVQLYGKAGVAGSGSTVTVTATISASVSFSDIKVEELSSTLGSWSGLTGLDSALVGGTGNSTALATSTGTPFRNNCALVTYGGANSGTITAGTGFTLRTTGANGLGLADLVQTTAASKAGLLTTSVSSQWTITAAFISEPVANYGSVSNTTGNFSGSGGTATVPVPSGIQANDILVIFLYREMNGQTVTCTGFSKPSNGASGFDEVAASNHSLYIGWKRATGSESGSFTINHDTNNQWDQPVCIRISGCITSGNPFDVISSSASGTNVQTTPVQAVTPTVENELLLFCGTSFNAGSWTPSGVTERFDNGDAITLGTLQVGTAAASGNKSATTTGAATRMIGWLAGMKSIAAAGASFDMKKASQFLEFF